MVYLTTRAYLHFTFDHLFSCDNDENVCKMIEANFQPKHVFGNVANRQVSQVPKVDIYVAGFPC